MNLHKNYADMTADFRKRGLDKYSNAFLWKKLVASHAKLVVFITEAQSWSKKMNTDIDTINGIDIILAYPKLGAKAKAAAALAKKMAEAEAARKQAAGEAAVLAEKEAADLAMKKALEEVAALAKKMHDHAKKAE